MSNLYITADQVGGWSGGSQVTFNESQALASLGPCEVWGREELNRPRSLLNVGGDQEPWVWDNAFCYGWPLESRSFKYPKLAHFYAGTFSRSVKFLKDDGVIISYTAAAHDVKASRREHQLLGIPYDYPHITQPDLWKRYVQGYLEADVLVCPSRHSAKVMQGFGFNGRIEIIPHGCILPTSISPLPERFTVGYLGAIGPDKGLRYLIEAWGKLAYNNATLVIAGRDSTHPFVSQMIHQWGGNANFNLLGWVEDVSIFYNSLSLYVQPSVTEGFGIEVLEAMAHGRPVVCSRGAGAWGLVIPYWDCKPADAEGLAAKIDAIRTGYGNELAKIGDINREVASRYTWSAIREKYVNLWKELLK